MCKIIHFSILSNGKVCKLFYTFIKAPINSTDGLRLGSGGESSFKEISSVGDTFNCKVMPSAPRM